MESVLHSIAERIEHVSHVYQFHQTPPAAFVGFRTVYSQAMDALHLLLYQIHQTPPATFDGFRTVYSQAMDALHLPLYQIHQTPPAAFVGFRTVYSQAMDALHLPLYQIHQTPPAAFVGFRTVYSQAMDALHLLLYQIHQTPPAAFVGFRTVYSQAIDALHLLLYQIHQTPPAAFVGFRTVLQPSRGCFAFATVPIPSNSTGCFCWDSGLCYSQAADALHLLLCQVVPFYCMLMDLGRFLGNTPSGLGLNIAFEPMLMYESLLDSSTQISDVI